MITNYKKNGCKKKHIINKIDGDTDPHADYFVLRLDEDPHARQALKSYIKSIRKENQELAKNLQEKLIEEYNEIVYNVNDKVKLTIDILEEMGYEPQLRDSKNYITIFFTCFGSENFTGKQSNIIEKILENYLMEFYYGGNNTQFIYIMK